MGPDLPVPRFRAEVCVRQRRCRRPDWGRRQHDDPTSPLAATLFPDQVSDHKGLIDVEEVEAVVQGGHASYGLVFHPSVIEFYTLIRSSLGI